jgi:uncharacterized protein YprB with RNaseH-like and TPR domain
MAKYPCRCGKEGFVTCCDKGWRIVNGEYKAVGIICVRNVGKGFEMQARMRTLLLEPLKAGDMKTVKEAIEWLVWCEENRCDKHRQNFLKHPGCLEKEYPGNTIGEKVAFLDIEATNLKANFGIVICWCIKPNRAKTVLEGCITAQDLRKKVWDERILKELLRQIVKFDRVVVHYGRRGKFDTPFLRSRCLHFGLDFPKNKSLWVSDTQMIARAALCLHSNRLGVVAEFLGIKTKKTPITSEHWLGALTGDKRSLEYILDYKELKDHAVIGRSSI